MFTLNSLGHDPPHCEWGFGQLGLVAMTTASDHFPPVLKNEKIQACAKISTMKWSLLKKTCTKTEACVRFNQNKQKGRRKILLNITHFKTDDFYRLINPPALVKHIADRPLVFTLSSCAFWTPAAIISWLEGVTEGMLFTSSFSLVVVVKYLDKLQNKRGLNVSAVTL